MGSAVHLAAGAMDKYRGRLDPPRLVYTDEAWAKTNMTHSSAPDTASCWSPRLHMDGGGR
jgi:hypothetical protein